MPLMNVFTLCLHLLEYSVPIFRTKGLLLHVEVLVEQCFQGTLLRWVDVVPGWPRRKARRREQYSIHWIVNVPVVIAIKKAPMLGFQAPQIGNVDVHQLQVRFGSKILNSIPDLEQIVCIQTENAWTHFSSRRCFSIGGEKSGHSGLRREVNVVRRNSVMLCHSGDSSRVVEQFFYLRRLLEPNK